MIGSAGPVDSTGALKSRIVPPCTARMASALAVSIGLPPPNPMIESAECCCTASRPATNESVVGSGTVPENNAGVFPASVMIFIKRSAEPLPAMNASVTSNGRDTSRSVSTVPSSSTAPPPSLRNRGNEMLETMVCSFAR